MAESSSSLSAGTAAAAAAGAARSDEETEELLDRMLTRLALCDDSKLEPLLSKLLPLTISSLSSQSTIFRNKVLEILSHVNKMVKHRPEIGLPLAELWKLYTDVNASAMVRNFCIVYIEMAFDRVPLKWTVKLSSFTIIRELCTRLLTLLDNNSEGTFHQESVPSWLQELFQSVSPKIVECIKTIKIAQVHINASECLLEITKLRRRLGPVHWIDTGFKEELLHQYKVEKNEEAKSFMKKCVDIFENVH